MQTANKNELDFVAAVLLHVNVVDLELPVWFGAVNELALDILVENALKRCHMRGILRLLRRITLRNLRPIQSARWDVEEKKKPTQSS